MKLKEINNLEEYKLCYVEDYFAYFTSKPLNKQWGDDWDDAPYEHNAGTPDEDEEGQILKVAYSSDLRTPNDGCINSPYSVRDINNGAVAWLYDRWGKSGVAIHAGCSVKEFIAKIKSSGGTVYFEVE